jgi:molybdopterin-synthase adenylyltransferase
MTRDFSRQADLVPMKDGLVCDVIGCGAIGRNVALQLAAIGVPEIRLFDFDSVDESNITTQGFWECEIGTTKVLSTRDHMQAIDPLIGVEMIADRWRPKYGLSEAVFVCVDKMSARQMIWEHNAHTGHRPFYVDGRMAGEVMRILTATDRPSREHYPTTLVTDEQAYQGRCTSKSTIYTANMAAGFMVHQLTRWLRGFTPSQDMGLSLLSMELTEER